MKATIYDWVKLALDNKWIVMLCLTGFSSLVTNAAQLSNTIALEETKTKAIHDVAKGFQAVIEEMETKPAKKVINKIYKSDCGICTTLMNDHKKEFH